MKNEFIAFVAGVLADTEKGISGTKIVEIFSGYAVDYGVEIPHSKYPFEASNKRTAFADNLKVFEEKEQYFIIKDIIDKYKFKQEDDIRKIKRLLLRDYHHLDDKFSEEININLIEETKHWLENYDGAFKLYNEALDKYYKSIYDRNIIDDIRLSLETLLQEVFSNSKNLENQLSNIGKYIEEKGCSVELSNMLIKLIDYFTKYNNNHIKHNDNVNEKEIEIIIELASSFMKYLIKIN